jgi:hypothetical protein
MWGAPLISPQFHCHPVWTLNNRSAVILCQCSFIFMPFFHPGLTWIFRISSPRIVLQSYHEYTLVFCFVHRLICSFSVNNSKWWSAPKFRACWIILNTVNQDHMAELLGWIRTVIAQWKKSCFVDHEQLQYLNKIYAEINIWLQNKLYHLIQIRKYGFVSNKPVRTEIASSLGKKNREKNIWAC